MTSPQIERKIHEIVLGGERTIVANLQEVNYISSAGLRVFLSAQKQLKKAGGEVILYGLSGYGLEVFKQGSLLRLFRMISSREELGSAFETAGCSPSLSSKAYEGISFQLLERKTHAGFFLKIGALEKLPSADYTEADVVTVRAEQMRSGTGLAALGEKYEDYKNLFGEAVLIDGNFFFYPAVRRPAVDFMLSADQEPFHLCKNPERRGGIADLQVSHRLCPLRGHESHRSEASDGSLRPGDSLRLQDDLWKGERKDSIAGCARAHFFTKEASVRFRRFCHSPGSFPAGPSRFFRGARELSKSRQNRRPPGGQSRDAGPWAGQLR
jgi:anti-anti-sigma factor